MKVKRLFFEVLLPLAIFFVNCTPEEEPQISEMLSKLNIHQPWDELSPSEQKFAFRSLTGMYNRLETTVIEVAIIDHIRRLLESFISRLCKEDAVVKETAKGIQNPKVQDIPPRLIFARENAKTELEKTNAKKHIETFNFVYRQIMAILLMIQESDNPEVGEFKKLLKKEGITYEKAALAGATLNSDLSDKIHNKNLAIKVNWNSKQGVIAGLNYWGITNPQVVSVASALHDINKLYGK